MRISGPITVSALVVAGLVASGSAAQTAAHSGAPTAPEPRLVAAAGPSAAAGSDSTVELVPAAPEPPRKLTAMAPAAHGMPPFGGAMPLQEISLPGGGGAFGIPEIVLAAYRNAELALQSSDPGCGLSWHLLAGIGKVESNHAGGGRTDADGTTVGVIYGPALDGTLAGNEVIQASDGNFVRAIGPMQFLPGTWSRYASDARGNGHPDPNNVFDAALAAGKYLCSGGLNLRDPQQEVRAVLRYNDSVAYASQVLSWSNAYKTGGVPTQVSISPELIPPGTMPEGGGMTAANSSTPTTTQPPAVTSTVPTPVMINIPGLPPIPCGIFCPPPQPKPCDPATAPAPLTKPGDAVTEQQRWAPGALGNQANPGEPAKPGAQPAPGGQVAPADGHTVDPNALQPNTNPQQPAACTQPQAPGQQPPAQQPSPGQPNAQAPAPGTNQQQAQNPAKTPEPGPAGPPPPAPATTGTPPLPAITLPFNIVIPLPAPGR